MILIDGEYWLPDADELDEWIFGEEWELVPLTRQKPAEIAYSMQFDPPAKVWRRLQRRPPVHHNCRCMVMPFGTRAQFISAGGKVEPCKT